MITSSIVQATVSVRRLAEFLASPELQENAVITEETPVAAGEVVSPGLSSRFDHGN